MFAKRLLCKLGMDVYFCVWETAESWVTCRRWVFCSKRNADASLGTEPGQPVFAARLVAIVIPAGVLFGRSGTREILMTASNTMIVASAECGPCKVWPLQGVAEAGHSARRMTT